jgi:hypothetical protein
MLPVAQGQQLEHSPCLAQHSQIASTVNKSRRQPAPTSTSKPSLHCNSHHHHHHCYAPALLAASNPISLRSQSRIRQHVFHTSHVTRHTSHVTHALQRFNAEISNKRVVRDASSWKLRASSKGRLTRPRTRRRHRADTPCAAQPAETSLAGGEGVRTGASVRSSTEHPLKFKCKKGVSCCCKDAASMRWANVKDSANSNESKHFKSHMHK